MVYNEEMTANFSEAEFLVSSTYPDIAKNMRLSVCQKNRLFLLSTFALEPIREKFGTTIITSGYRDPLLNEAIGGVNTSQHCKAEAVDFICPKAKSMKAVYNWILRTLAWKGELIYYSAKGHIHIGLPNLAVHPDHFIKQ